MRVRCDPTSSALRHYAADLETLWTARKPAFSFFFPRKITVGTPQARLAAVATVRLLDVARHAVVGVIGHLTANRKGYVAAASAPQSPIRLYQFHYAYTATV